MATPKASGNRPKAAATGSAPPRAWPGETETALSRLVRWLRARVLGGVWRPGQPLPPARALARRLQVSAPTAQRAYQILIDEGLVEARLRRGCYPVQLPLRDRLRRGLDGLEAGLAPALEDAVLAGLSQTQIRLAFVHLLAKVWGAAHLKTRDDDGGHLRTPRQPAIPASRHPTPRQTLQPSLQGL
jgi:DNA-binding transcriptional regulator YhcF (GntR family)